MISETGKWYYVTYGHDVSVALCVEGSHANIFKTKFGLKQITGDSIIKEYKPTFRHPHWAWITFILGFLCLGLAVMNIKLGQRLTQIPVTIKEEK